MSLAVTEAKAAVLIYDDFSGNNADNVNGTTPDTNTFNSNTWVADAGNFLRADGTAIDEAGGSNNVDVGAFLSIGSGIFATNTTYTVTLDFGQLADSALFLGFTNAASPSTSTTAQIQGTANLAIRVRDFGGSDSVAIWNRVGSTNNVTSVVGAGDAFDDASYTVVMTINSNSLTDADVTVSYGGSEQTINGVDISSLSSFYYAVEDANTGAQGNMGVVNSATFTQIPEPTSSALLCLGLGGILLRRRR